MTVTQARAALPEVLDRVLAGEEVTLTRHGQAVAVIVRPDTLRARRFDTALATATKVHELLDQGRRTRLRAHPKISEQRADAMVAEIRAGRAKR